MFKIFTESSCNLPQSHLDKYDVSVLCWTYLLDGKEVTTKESIDNFDGHKYYDRLRDGAEAKTSLINTESFLKAFEPVVAGGQDAVFILLSSGISGTYQSAVMAADILSEKYENKVYVIDSKGAGFGVGLLVCRAGELRKKGKNASETAEILTSETKNLCQFFTVGSLTALRKGGRISGATAIIGTALQIKPILYGCKGKIEAYKKVRGRKASILELAELYRQKVVDAGKQLVAISHCDCPEEAGILADLINSIAKPLELLVRCHEPMTGSHLGPDSLALFFMGNI